MHDLQPCGILHICSEVYIHACVVFSPENTTLITFLTYMLFVLCNLTITEIICRKLFPDVLLCYLYFISTEGSMLIVYTIINSAHGPPKIYN